MNAHPYDKSNLYQVLSDFPGQFAKGLNAAKDIVVRGRFRNVIVCGMGGSALPADVLRTFVPFTGMPLYTARGYHLPLQAGSDSLVVCITFSGNTEETLSTFNEALHLGCKVVCITTGGKLRELCRQNGVPVAMVPEPAKGFQPRYGLGYMFAMLAKILSNSGVMPNKDADIMDMAEGLRNFTFHEQASQIAKRLYKKIPVVYSSDRNQKVARIWKIKLNETAKVMAFYNYFPELNHNEMSGHTNAKLQGNFHNLIITDEADHPRVQKRMRVMADMLKARGEEITFISIKEDPNKLLKTFSALLLGDWVAYYLSREYKTDPMPVELVEELKRRLED
jgi:glucose/mannose-6-phosphate isomerase